MLEFIQALLQGYRRAQLRDPAGQNNAKPYTKTIDQLLLAEALLRKSDLIKQFPALPLQIAVIGPTQAGKSSIVNALLHSNSAGVSPLAGFTVHPQGFCHKIGVMQCTGLQNYFGRFQQLSQVQLSKQRFDCYALSESPFRVDWLPECVVWDSPDFDSIDAADYREGVLRTIALADVIILAVSKEKYADQSVWDIMAALEPLQQPTLLCVNKLLPGSENLILPSVLEKWQASRSDAFPEVLPWFYQNTEQTLPWPEAGKQPLLNLLAQARQRKPTQIQLKYYQFHWQNWLKPLHAELAAADEWQQFLEHNFKQVIEHYQRDYLNHPQHYETFQNALAELLNLLEIPGIAPVFSGTRKLLTWPLKQLFKLGKSAKNSAESSHESLLLKQLGSHLFIQLADRLMDQSNAHQNQYWWKDLALLLRDRRSILLADFQGQVITYHEQFKAEISQTAERVYHKLEEQPLLLNSLRAARATTDAAAIALTIKTGGIGLHDLLFAPAMLAASSLLTESAIGGYLKRVEAELKVKQLNRVQQLFQDSLLKPLRYLPTQLAEKQYFNISPEQLQRAEQQINDKPHGLRFF